MKHKKEIKRWANSPDGTKVWVKIDTKQGWVPLVSPSFIKENVYIVDDEYATMRKAFMDGVTIQYNNCDNHWRDLILDSDVPVAWGYPVENYRIKPEEPKVKKVPTYQIVFRTDDVIPFSTSELYYKDVDEFKKHNISKKDTEAYILPPSVMYVEEVV